MQLILKLSCEQNNAENFFIVINAINNKRSIKDRFLFVPLTTTQTPAESQWGCLLPGRLFVKTPELKKNHVPDETSNAGYSGLLTPERNQQQRYLQLDVGQNSRVYSDKYPARAQRIN